MESITINTTRLSDYSGITIDDETDWSDITGSLDSLTSITLNFYTDSTETTAYTYILSDDEISSYTTNGTLDFTFEDLFSREYALDNWYNVQMTANDSDYVSNYSGFGSDAYMTVRVNENINSLHTPEQYRETIEQIAIQKMFLDGMKYLDVSDMLNRDIKWKLRYETLRKLNL